jgi:hypothetical protein
VVEVDEDPDGVFCGDGSDIGHKGPQAGKGFPSSGELRRSLGDLEEKIAFLRRVGSEKPQKNVGLSEVIGQQGEPLALSFFVHLC